MTLTYPELKTFVSGIVTKAKLSNDTFNVTRDNTVHLLDKVGKIVSLDTMYQTDKLSMFDGETLSFGKTVEEWAEDLILPQDKDASGANTLAPHDPSARPAFYSYTIGSKTIATTIRNNDIQRAVHFEAQLVELVSMKLKRQQDSLAAYLYEVKREMLAKFIAICEDEMDSTNPTFVASTAYNVNELLKDGGSPAKYGIVFKPIVVADALANWAAAVAGGFIVELDLITEIAKPVDTSTGEAFIEQVKKDVEIAKDLNAGHSLNGNALGATEGLVLICKQGVMPSLDVNTLAGAFHLDKVAIPSRVIVIKDFGSADADYFAVLLDSRAMRLYNTYRASRDQINAEGDFVNIFLHTEDTAYISRNAFIKVYKEP